MSHERTSSGSSSSGIGVCGLLGVAFVVLKLLHIINWSWWWVTLPFWVGFATFIVIMFTGILFAVIMGTIQNRKRRMRHG